MRTSNKILRLFKKALRLHPAQLALVIETVVLLALARSAVVLLPFRWVARVLGTPEAQTSRELADPSHFHQIHKVRQLIRKTARHVPWTSKCLDQAIAAKFMLGCRGILSTVYFGVRNDQQGILAAHAWLRSGWIYVTGGQEKSGYVVIHTFADERI